MIKRVNNISNSLTAPFGGKNTVAMPALMLVAVEISSRISGEFCSNTSRGVPLNNQPEIPPLVSHVNTADLSRKTTASLG